MFEAILLVFGVPVLFGLGLYGLEWLSFTWLYRTLTRKGERND